MKKTIITFLLSLVSFWGISQSTAIKMKLRYWNNSEHRFSELLTKDGKKLLDSVLTISKIDTSKCVKVDYNDISEYTNRKYLTNRNYTYITYSIYNGILNKTFYKNFNGYSKSDNQKIILYHTTDNNQIDIVSLYVIE